MSVRNALLGLLSQKARHGYELRAAFEVLAGGEENWDVKPAQIYSTLTRLEEAGLVTEEDDGLPGVPDKRVYCITPAGQDELFAWFEAPVSSEHQRDEFFLKLMLSLSAEGADPGRVIQAQRSLLYRDLHELTVRRDQANPRNELAQIFLLDKAIMHLEADLRWLDMIEGRIDDIQRQPPPELHLRSRGRPRKVGLEKASQQ